MACRRVPWRASPVEWARSSAAEAADVEQSAHNRSVPGSTPSRAYHAVPVLIARGLVPTQGDLERRPPFRPREAWPAVAVKLHNGTESHRYVDEGAPCSLRRPDCSELSSGDGQAQSGRRRSGGRPRCVRGHRLWPRVRAGRQRPSYPGAGAVRPEPAEALRVEARPPPGVARSRSAACQFSPSLEQSAHNRSVPGSIPPGPTSCSRTHNMPTQGDLGGVRPSDGAVLGTCRSWPPAATADRRWAGAR